MIDFQLFRTKVRLPSQTDLFVLPVSRPDLLRRLVENRPSAELRAGYVWHIGNLHRIDDNGLYFAVGRTTRSTIELWNDDAGEFAEAEFESAPYTHAVMDLELQVCALGRKSRLAPTITGIGRQLEKLFNRGSTDILQGATVEVSPIKDPEGFIEVLRRAHSIRQFGAEFSLPNPFDAEEDFQKPLELVLKKANGSKGKTVLKGEHLAPEVLEEIARSAAASGANADARLQLTSDAPLVRRTLSGNVVSAQQDDVSSEDERLNLLEKIRALYSRVRTTTSQSDEE